MRNNDIKKACSNNACIQIKKNSLSTNLLILFFLNKTLNLNSLSFNVQLIEYEPKVDKGNLSLIVKVNLEKLMF